MSVNFTHFISFFHAYHVGTRVVVMDKHSVEQAIRQDKAKLKQLHEAARNRHRKPEEHQQLVRYYTLMQKTMEEKARYVAMQNMTLYVLGFIAAISWERALRTSMERLFQGTVTPWRVNVFTAMGVTALVITLASRWAVSD